MERAGDVYELRFEPRHEERRQSFVKAMIQAVLLADPTPDSSVMGPAGWYVVSRRDTGAELLRLDVQPADLGATRAHLTAQLAELTPEELVAAWTSDDTRGEP